MKNGVFDIVHAHYSLSGFICVFALSGKPIFVSLMGSDVKGNRIMRFFIRMFSRFFWDVTIVKSSEMKVSLAYKKAYVIPNGVDMDKFHPMNKLSTKKRLGWDSDVKHILFPADPARKVKNFLLANIAVEKITQWDCQLHYLSSW